MSVHVTFAPRNTVPTPIKLTGYVYRLTSSGVTVDEPGFKYATGDVEVVMPLLFARVNDRVAVAPVVEADGNSLRIDLTRWLPARHTGSGGLDLFVIAFDSADSAAEAALALDADPHANWHWSAEAATAWCRQFDDRP